MKKLILIFFILPFCLQGQNIYTYAGNGTPGYSGDGGPAIQAQLEAPTGVVADNNGNLYFCEWYYGLIRKVDATGIITTIAGGLTTNLSDGIPATNAFVKHPWGLTIDALGNLYFAEQQYNQVRKINTSGIITTVAGVANQTGSFSGDGGLAVSARLNGPSDVAVDFAGNVYIADGANHRIRMINTSGIISTIAGSTLGFAGDGGPAINAKFYYPLGIAVDKKNNIYIGDAQNHRIRKIDTSGIINTIVGTGVQGNTGDGGTAISAEMGSTRGLQVDSSGNLFFADRDYGSIRKVNASGIITKIAGTGVGGGYSGDGGPATSAQFYYPIDVTLDNVGNLYISDNMRIRKICGNIPLTIQSSTSLTCAYQPIILSMSGASTYSWSTGSTYSTTVVVPSVTTTFTVNVSDGVGCSNSGVITQSVNPVPSLTVTASSNSGCASESTTISASGAGTYTWSTGDSTPDIIVSPSATTIYTVEGFNIYGCSATSATTVYGIPVPSLTVTSSSNSICASESSTITASGADTYTWSTGSINPTIIVSPGVTTTYTVEGFNSFGCSTTTVSTLIVDPCVGIKEYDLNEIKIYPNPATNTLHISNENKAFENSTIEVINYLGQPVLKQGFSNTIDVSQLPTGIYTLKILTSGKESLYSKFIKE